MIIEYYAAAMPKPATTARSRFAVALDARGRRQPGGAAAADGVEPGDAGRGSDDMLAVRRHRRQAAAMLLQGDVAEHRELHRDAVGEAAQHLEVERHVLDAELGRHRGHVV